MLNINRYDFKFGKKNLECRVDRPNMIQDFFCENVLLHFTAIYTGGGKSGMLVHDYE